MCYFLLAPGQARHFLLFLRRDQEVMYNVWHCRIHRPRKAVPILIESMEETGVPWLRLSGVSFPGQDELLVLKKEGKLGRPLKEKIGRAEL